MNVFVKIKITILVLISVINICFAQTTVQRVEISPLNRATIYLSSYTDKYQSELSQDKKKVSLKLNNTKVEESARTTHSTGIIQDVYVQSFKNNLEISLILQDKRGYTSIPLEYSQSIMIEVFKWDNISPAEDSYRSGLLAIESNLASGSLEFFKKAVTLQHPESAYFLGLIYLKQGKINSALELFKFAESKNANIPDLYAGLSQIYKIKADYNKSKQYSDLFYKKTKRNSYNDILINLINSNDSTIDDPALVAALINSNGTNNIGSSTFSDSLNNAHGKEQDSLQKAFKNLFSNDSLKNTENENISFFMGINPVALLVIIVFLFIAAVFLWFSYIKWRQKKIEAIKQKNTMDNSSSKKLIAMPELIKNKNKTKITHQNAIINKNTKTNDKVPLNAALASKLYHNNQNSTETINQKNSYNNIDNKNFNKNFAINPENNNNFENDFTQKLESIAENLYNANKDNSDDIQHLPDFENDNISNDLNNDTVANPNLELAMHLKDEQKKIKQKNIEQLDEKQIPKDKDNLSEFAKKLGLEKSSIETKKNIKELENNANELNKLAEKFNDNSKQL